MGVLGQERMGEILWSRYELETGSIFQNRQKKLYSAPVFEDDDGKLAKPKLFLETI
jgi:hypothetical protein